MFIKSLTARRNWQYTVPLLAILLSRLLLYSMGTYSHATITDEWVYALKFPMPEYEQQPAILAAWLRWDAVDFVAIAEEGYARADLGFSPLYPAIIWLVSLLFAGNMLLSAMVVSNLLFYIALVLLFRLTVAYTESAVTAVRAVVLATLFPPGFHFAVPYSEALFFMLVLAAATAAQARRWWLASLVAFLAGLTRMTAPAVFVLVVVEWLNAHGVYVRRLFMRENWVNLWEALKQHGYHFIGFLLMPVGMFAWLVAVANSDSNHAEIATSTLGIVSIFTYPIRTIENLTRIAREGGGTLEYLVWMSVILSIIMFVLLIPIWRRFREGDFYFAFFSIFIPSYLGFLGATHRYISVIYPLYILLAMWTATRPRVYRALVYTFTLGYLLSGLLFTRFLMT